MDEALYLKAAENRKHREHLQRNINEVKAAVNRVSNRGERVIIQATDAEYAANIGAGLLWKALDWWLEDAQKKVIELDRVFHQL